LAWTQLRVVAAHREPELDSLVRRHWGNVASGTSEEKLATMRRLANDLRSAPGVPSRGQPLFRKHCATCHRLFGEGGQVGPELDSANRGDRGFLLASLVDPSAVIRRQYLGYTVTTRGGRVVTGVLAEQDGGAVTLLDAQGQRVRLPRSEIESLIESETSPMPERILEALTPDELRDLFAYLEGNAPLENGP
jgi:putative heme-binding domain-containing protein